MASTALTPVVHSTFHISFFNQSKSNSLLIRPNQCLSLSIYRNFNLFLSQSKPSCISLIQSSRIPIFPGNRRLDLVSTRNSSSIVRSYNARDESGGDPQQKGSGLNWPILRRWDVPWPWQTVTLTSLACGISFVVTGLIETQALPFFGIQIAELTSDEKAELLLVDQGIATAVVLGILFNFTKSFQPLPDEIYRYGNHSIYGEDGCCGLGLVFLGLLVLLR